MDESGSKSKRPSAANSASKQPDPSVFFLDRSLGKKILSGILKQNNLQVEVHDDHFPVDARDEEWLTGVGKKGWIVVTKDQRIRNRRNELAALLRNGVRAFAFTRGSLTAEEMASIFLSALPKIRRLLRADEGPFIATISRGGEVTRLSTSQ